MQLSPSASAALALLLFFSTARAQQNAGRVSFRAEVAPLLNRRCAACHGEDSAKGKYRLDTFARLLKPGSSDAPPVVARKAEESELYRLLVEPDAHDRMPQKADALPASEIALIKRWIDEGAAYDGGSREAPLVELARATLLRPAPKHYARPAPVTALAFSPNAKHVAASGFYEILVCRSADGSLAKRVGGLPERITAIAWHPTRDLVAVAGGSPGQWGTIALIEPATDAKPRFLCDLPETALSVVFSPDGKSLAAGCGDRTIRIFETASGKQTRVLRQHADWVQTVAFSKDGQRLVSASRDRTARIFDLGTGDLEATYSGHDAPVLTAVFSPGGSGILSVGRGKTVHLWDAATGVSKKKKNDVVEIPNETQQLALAGDRFVTATSDDVLRVYQLSDRKPLLTLFGHHDFIESIAVARGAEMLASGSHDGEVCVWNWACETPVLRFVASPR